MQITEIVSLNKKQIKEKQTLQTISNNLNEQLSDLFVDMRLQSLLLEDLDVKQLSDGDWVVWDTDTDKAAGSTRFSSAGEAEEARDGMRRTRASSNDRPDNKDDSGSKRTGRNAKYAKAHFKSSFKNGPISLKVATRRTWLFSLAAALGLSVDWGSSDSDGLDDPKSQNLGNDFGDTTLLYWYQQAEGGTLHAFSSTKAGAESYEDLTQDEVKAHADANIQKYKRMVALAYGSVCSLYYVAIMSALVGPVYKIGKGAMTAGLTPLTFIRNPKATYNVGAANVRKFIRYARRYRNIFTAASAAAGAIAGAGVGGIVTGLVSFILGTGALWAVEYVLTRSGAAGKVLEWMVYKMLEADYANEDVLGFISTDFIAGVGEFTNTQATDIVNSVTSDDQTEIIDISRDLLTNPQAQDADKTAINALIEPSANNNTGSNNGSTAGPATNGNDASQRIRKAVDDILQ